MFGLTLEKVIIIGIFAAILVGPQQLPRYAHYLANAVRSFRQFLENMKGNMERDMGIPMDAAEWNRQIERYDPRAVVKQALAEPTYRWETVGGSSGHPQRRLVQVAPTTEKQG